MLKGPLHERKRSFSQPHGLCPAARGPGRPCRAGAAGISVSVSRAQRRAQGPRAPSRLLWMSCACSANLARYTHGPQLQAPPPRPGTLELPSVSPVSHMLPWSPQPELPSLLHHDPLCDHLSLLGQAGGIGLRVGLGGTRPPACCEGAGRSAGKLARR